MKSSTITVNNKKQLLAAIKFAENSECDTHIKGFGVNASLKGKKGDDVGRKKYFRLIRERLRTTKLH